MEITYSSLLLTSTFNLDLFFAINFDVCDISKEIKSAYKL